MKTVSVSDLKAHLSQYLRDVRRGDEVQVVDRGVPIARLVPMSGVEGDDADRWDRLVRAGVLRAGSGDASFVLEEPPLAVPNARLSAALDDDREDR